VPALRGRLIGHRETAVRQRVGEAPRICPEKALYARVSTSGPVRGGRLPAGDESVVGRLVPDADPARVMALHAPPRASPNGPIPYLQSSVLTEFVPDRLCEFCYGGSSKMKSAM
jgi:hypothetical protein